MGRRWTMAAAMLAAAVGLAGCGSGMPIPAVEMRPPPEMGFERTLATLRFHGATIAIAPGTTIGGYGGNVWQCAGRSDPIAWQMSRTEVFSRSFSDIFYDRLNLAGYRTTGDPSNLFADIERGRPRTDYLVGARIDEIRLDLCHQRDLLTGDEKFLKTGQGYVRVQWQVFSQALRKVVWQATTEGVATLEDPSPMAVQLLINGAFGTAASNFAAEPRLLELVSRDPTQFAVADRQTGPTPLLVPQRPLRTTPLAEDADAVRAAVATVDTGTGHGSAVFIAPSLLLTNHHVVEGHESVMVRDASGRFRKADVLRRDGRRDVALLQLAETVAEASVLPIRLTPPPAIGEEVYVVGTPGMKGLAGTVTRGIVSGFPRNDRGLTDIQADAAVSPGNSGGALVDGRGNLIGLTYAGFQTDGGAPLGLNLFIGIADALAKLGLVVEEPLPAGAEPWDDYPTAAAD